MFFGRPKTAMWAMLRCSHFVNISIQALQTSSNVNSIMLNERKKREHALLLYSLKASKKKVAKLHVFECDLVQPCGRCCAARILSIFRFKPYKLHRMSTASSLLCARKENMLCLEGHSVIYSYVLVMQCVLLLQKGLGMEAEDVRQLDCSNVS